MRSGFFLFAISIRLEKDTLKKQQSLCREIALFLSDTHQDLSCHGLSLRGGSLPSPQKEEKILTSDCQVLFGRGYFGVPTPAFIAGSYRK